MNKDQFYARLAPLDEAALRKALWTVYWRGSAPVRERIETAIDPSASKTSRAAARKAPPDPAVLAGEVEEFVDLARAGAYMGGDRRVSPKERSRWRFTFKALARDAVESLTNSYDEESVSALVDLVDLADELRGREYFRSEDPVEAARFVVSDAVDVLWSAVRRERGFPEFAERAAPQLVRWESRFGWSRSGYGWVAGQETTLARVLERQLPAGDAWIVFADQYLSALDDAGGGSWARRSRADALSDWHTILLERLADGDGEDRLDLVAHHRELAGPELTFFQAQIAARRGDVSGARTLIRECLQALPGHQGFKEFARDLGEGTAG